MNTIRLEEIRRRLADCGPLDAGSGHDAVSLLSEVDRLREVLTTISTLRDRECVPCGTPWGGDCDHPPHAEVLAAEALEGTP